MALSIVETLDQFGFIEPDFLAERFAARYAQDPNRGYGPTAMEVLEQIGTWHFIAARKFNKPQRAWASVEYVLQP